EPRLLRPCAASPADVHSPDGGRAAVSQPREFLALIREDPRVLRRDGAAALGEADGRAEFVAQALALLFIRGDPISPPGRHVFHPEEVLHRHRQCGAALLAKVRRRLVPERVDVAALLATGGPPG